MPNLTADPAEIRDTIDDRSDVDDLLEEASDYEREAKKRERKVEQSTANLREQKEQIEEQIEEIESEHEDYIERRRQAVQNRAEAIEDWARANQDEMLDGCEGKTYEGVFGQVSFTTVPFNFSWDDKDAVIENLKAIGREELVRVTEKPPYKSTLKDEPELVEQLDGVTPEPEHESVTVTLDVG